MSGGGRRDDEPAWVPVTGEGAPGGGRLAHILGVHELHPSALEAHLRLYRTLMFGPSPLSRRERESLAVAVSGLNDCFY